MVQILTGLLLSGVLLDDDHFNALDQSVCMMVLHLSYGIALVVCRPHLNTQKNVFDVIMAGFYSLVFFGSIMLVRIISLRIMLKHTVT